VIFGGNDTDVFEIETQKVDWCSDERIDLTFFKEHQQGLAGDF